MKNALSKTWLQSIQFEDCFSIQEFVIVINKKLIYFQLKLPYLKIMHFTSTVLVAS